MSEDRHARHAPYFFGAAPDVLLPVVLGLPEVPVSPVPPEEPDVPPELLPLEPDVPDEPEVPDEGELDDEEEPGVLLADPETDELLLPGVLDVSVLLPEGVDVLLDGLELAVVVEEGEVDELDEVLPLPEWFLSQPVTAAPARARAATTGMIFFMEYSDCAMLIDAETRWPGPSGSRHASRVPRPCALCDTRRVDEFHACINPARIRKNARRGRSDQ
jgi:hypothetical protein